MLLSTRLHVLTRAAFSPYDWSVESDKDLSRLTVVKDPPDAEVEVLPPEPSPELVAVAPAPMKAYSLKETSVSDMAALMSRVSRKAYDIVSYALAAAEIDNDSEKPAGWSDKKYRVAKDARKNKRDAPTYLDLAMKAHASAQALEAMNKVVPAINVEMIQIVDQRQYPMKIEE